jgi:hypothetical protein
MSVIIYRRRLLGMRTFLGTLVEKINTRTLCSTIVVPKWCRLCENVEKIMVQTDKPQITIQYGACVLHAA